ncbi:MAG: YggS family pyridoxal phosphate-dependent enzyme [Alicyclobacillus sp.]|nr:YggS family pyridoxal phosphate-dependent enzyme [Alicyclobacillus sp.]
MSVGHKAAGAEGYRAQLEAVQAEVARACARAGRDPRGVRIIAVTKYVDETAIPMLLAAGLREFGENRWQQARTKLSSPAAASATWHFIGRLQSNKAKQVAQSFDWIHSIDSADIGRAVSQAADRAGRTVRCLVQVNVSGEGSKAGVPPEAARGLVAELMTLPGLDVRGLMTMAPAAEDPEQTRPVFRALADLLREIRQDLGVPALQELSMGMSNDFRVAVEEGATMVRIGRRLVLPGE